MNKQNGLLTIAIGRRYVKQAKYLALSCMLHSPHTVRAVITDDGSSLKNYYDLIIPYNADFGDPFAAKLRLPLYTPFEKTLYLDADSLVFGNLDDYFNLLQENTVLYAGERITKGTWYMDIAKVMAAESLPWIPKFNSGMLVFRNHEAVKEIFDTAFGYLTHHNERNIGIEFFRENMLPDEPFFALAFAKHGVAPSEDYGRFSRTLIRASKLNINVKKGIARFLKDGRMVHPLAVHFCGRFGAVFYLREKLRLYFYFHSPLSAFVSFLLVRMRDMLR